MKQVEFERLLDELRKGKWGRDAGANLKTMWNNGELTNDQYIQALAVCQEWVESELGALRRVFRRHSIL
jgi:hypothetical protein